MPTEIITIDMTEACVCCGEPGECPCGPPPDAPEFLNITISGSCVDALVNSTGFDYAGDDIDQVWEAPAFGAACCVSFQSAVIRCISGVYRIFLQFEYTDPDTFEVTSAGYEATLTVESCDPALWTATNVAPYGVAPCLLGDNIDIELTE